MKRNFYLFLVVILSTLLSADVHAQTPGYVSGTWTGTPGGNTIPMYYTGACRGQHLYPGTTFGTVPSGMGINRIYFASGTSGTQPYSNFEVKLGQKNISSLTNNYETGLTTVLNATNYNVTRVAGQWFAINLTTAFPYTPGVPLIVEINQQTSGGGSYSCFVQPTVAGSWRNYSTAYNSATAAGNGAYMIYFGFDLVSLIPPAPPVANFYLPTTGCQFTPTTIINNSQPNSASPKYKWTFTPSTVSYLKGTNDSSIRPIISFNDSVSYNVKLRVTNGLGSDSITKTINIRGASVVPVADFYSSPRIVPEATYVQMFYDLSTECPSAWAWSCPDYESTWMMSPFIDSTRQDAQAFFAFSGVWDVCLRASNAIGSHTTCKTDYITVLPADNLCNDTISNQAAGFIMDEGTATNSYGNNRTLSNCKGYLIDPCASSITLTFDQIKLSAGAGDSIYIHNGPNQNSPRLAAYGANANGTFPSLTANSGKMFIYMLTNASGVDSGFVARWSSTPATYSKPTASYNLSQANGLGVDTFYSGYPIQFNNTTTGVDAKFIWDVDGNSALDSTVANPKGVRLVNFGSTPLTFTTMLMAYNCQGYDTVYKNIVILPVTSKPTAINFIADKFTVTANDTITLTDLSLGSSDWEWSFTPNTVSYIAGFNKFSQNPKIRLSGAGCIRVQMKVSNTSGSDSVAKNCYIRIRSYCPPATANGPTSDIGFSRVQMGNIDNSTICGAVEFANFYDSAFGATPVYRGNTYSITLSRPSNNNNVSWKGWIDYNLDGIFNETSELVLSEINFSGTSKSFNITVPSNAIIGSTVLRLGASINSTFLTPCAGFAGEYEDYKITVVNNNVAPVITLVGADTVCIERMSSYTDAGATATDDLEGNITSKLIKSSTVDSSIVGFFKVCYDVTDLYGNVAATKCRVVCVRVDMTPPVITLSGKNPDTTAVGAPYNEPGFTATDNFAGNITALVVVDNDVNEDSVGVYTITYDVQDPFGFSDRKVRTVHVVDRIAPVISRATSTTNHIHSVGLPLDDKLVINVNENYWKTVTYNRTGSVNVNTLGTYAVTYTVTDGSGNVSNTLNFNIEVKDTTKPTINVVGADTLTFEVFTNYVDPVPTATDNFYTNVTVSSSSAPTFNKNVVGTYLITYTSTDGSGNTSTRTRVIKIVDTQNPVISLKGGSTIIWSLGKPWVDPGVQIVDNYYSESVLLPLMTSTTNLDVTVQGSYEICYQVTDPSNNKSNKICRTVITDITSVNEVTDGVNVNVYPNPSNGKFEVAVTLDEKSDVIIKITDVLGKVINSVNVNQVTEANVPVDLSQVSAGVYFVQVINGNSITTKKISINK
jgi:PKD repeat protein